MDIVACMRHLLTVHLLLVQSPQRAGRPAMRWGAERRRLLQPMPSKQKVRNQVLVRIAQQMERESNREGTPAH